MGRSSYVPMSSFILLDHACGVVSDAFGGNCPYHVGSSTQRADWRDVDVRLILPDDEFDQLFADHGSLWSLLCLSTSEYLSRVSGLPVDFQVQRRTEANDEYGDQFRNPLGVSGRPRQYAGGLHNAAGTPRA